MRIEKLSPLEKALISNPKDLVYLELIKGMNLRELKEFDVYIPLNLKDYNHHQMGWIQTEKYLIGKKTHKEVSDNELIEDFTKQHTPERYKAFYVLKYPYMVERKN